MKSMYSKIVMYSFFSATLLASQLSIATEELVVAEKTKVVNGKSYTFTKLVDKNGNDREVVTNDKGRIVNGNIAQKNRDKVDRKLRKELEKAKSSGEKIKMNIAFYTDLPPDESEEAEQGSIEALDGIIYEQSINDVLVDEEQVRNKHVSDKAKQSAKRERQYEKQIEVVSKWAEKHGLSNKEGLKNALAGGYSSVTLELSAEEIEALLRQDDSFVAGYEVYEEGSDDITQAMADTSISTSALIYSTTRGDGIGIYMTESGCANESRITNYDRLSGSETNHSRNVGAIIRAVSPDSFLYCRGGAVLPQNSDLDGVGGNPEIYIVTRSNSNNDTTNYNTLDRDWDNFVYNKNVATFNSGGNTGNGTGNVRSPGKGLNIITVGNYNDSNNAIVSSSPFVDPSTGNEKPEVVAPGANITAGGFTYTGTSQATPHAAAFAADMMSSSTYLKNRPYLVKAKMLAGATDSINGGSEKVGLGGIDFASAQWSGYAQYYSGSNSAFNTFDSNDGSSDGYISKRIYISSSWNKVRAVIAWLNRGTYTYDHRNDSHPIGMDLDLKIYDPNGNYVGGSFSWDNPYERVNFSPSITGYYTFKIKRYANRDTSSSLRLGMYVNYYN